MCDVIVRHPIVYICSLKITLTPPFSFHLYSVLQLIRWVFGVRQVERTWHTWTRVISSPANKVRRWRMPRRYRLSILLLMGLSRYWRGVQRWVVGVAFICVCFVSLYYVPNRQNDLVGSTFFRYHTIITCWYSCNLERWLMHPRWVWRTYVRFTRGRFLMPSRTISYSVWCVTIILSMHDIFNFCTSPSHWFVCLR